MFPQMVRRKRRVQEGRQCPVSHIGFGVPHSLENGRRLAAIVRIAIIKSLLLLLLFLGFVILLVSVAPSLLSFGSFFPHDCADAIPLDEANIKRSLLMAAAGSTERDKEKVHLQQ